VTKKIEDLRELLFETLTDLRDKDKPMEIERAKAVADVARVLVDSAKVEVEYLRLAGGKGSGFMPIEEAKPGTPRLVQGIAQSGSK
jgi:hypothetical protein